MAFKSKYFILNPKTNEKITVPELSRILNCTYITAYNRVLNFTSGRIAIEDVYKPLSPRKTAVTRSFQTAAEKDLDLRRENIADRVFVFRPDCVSESGDVYSYSAYDASDPTVEIMSSIVLSVDGWMYNAYIFGCFKTRNDLVKAYLHLKLKAKRYDPSPDYLVEEYIELIYGS